MQSQKKEIDDYKSMGKSFYSSAKLIVNDNCTFMTYLDQCIKEL